MGYGNLAAGRGEWLQGCGVCDGARQRIRRNGRAAPRLRSLERSLGWHPRPESREGRRDWTKCRF
jgi:hypothetical protein